MQIHTHNYSPLREEPVSTLTRDLGVDPYYIQRIDELADVHGLGRGRPGSKSKGGLAAPRFVKAAKIALRVAFWTWMTGVGVWLLRQNESLPDIYISYLNGVVIAIIFNVTTNVATTLKNVIQSFVGTAFAILVCLLQYQMPNPYREDPELHGPAPPTCPAEREECDASSRELYQWYCMDSPSILTPPSAVTFLPFLAYAVFVAVTLCLNVVRPFKTFALVAALNFMMNFANPAVDSTGYMDLRWDSVLVVTLVMQLSGSTIAILAMMLPPVTATRTSTELAAAATKRTAELLLYITSYYCGSGKTLEINVYNSQLARNREDMGEEGTDLDIAWWEYFDWGSCGVARLLLQDHLKMLKDLDSRLSVLQTAVLREKFEDKHKSVMAKMKAPMLSVVRTTSECLLNCTICAADGHISPEEFTALQSQKEAVKSSIAELAFAWRRSRGNADSALSEELRTEGFFLVELSTLARVVATFAERLQTLPRPKNIALTAVKNAFSMEKIKDPEYRNFVLRSWISLMVAWWWACIANGYSTAIPINVVLMLTEQPGNALLQNLQKLQASVLGSLAGTSLYRAFSSCSFTMRLVKLMLLFLWELASMFIANYTKEYAIVGLLLAVYGSGKLMMVCDPHNTNGEVQRLSSEEFRSLRFFAYAMCIVSFVDFLLKRQPASDQAREKLLKAMDISLSYFKTYLQGRAKVGLDEIWEETAKVSEDVEKLLDEAEALVASADQEPRFQKGPFKTALFSDLCARTRRMTLQARVLVRRSEGGSTGLWSEMQRCRSFEAVKRDLLKTIDDTRRIVGQVICYDSFGAMDPSIFHDVIGESGVDQVDDLKHLEADVKALDLKVMEEAKESLEYSRISRFAAVFELLEIYVQELASMLMAAVEHM